ncbi:unnamed protein product [Closterium sp. NIES-64]|nr:unnamed protein product [Closterium sp. NIES-64]
MEALKGHDVVLVAGGASVSLAGENKDILLNEDADFSVPCLDFACLLDDGSCHCSILLVIRLDDLVSPDEENCGTRVLHIESVPDEDKHSKLADDVVGWFARVVASENLEPDLKKEVWQRALVLRREWMAVGDSSAGNQNRKVDDAGNEKGPAAPTAEKNTAADDVDKATPPRVTENRLEVASGRGGKWPKRSGGRSAEQLSKLPALTLAHEVVRLEAEVCRLKELANTQERRLAHQRDTMSELMGRAEESQEGFERALTTMNRLVARADDADKRGRKDVANAVQEMRVERANATSQRETAALTFARLEAAVVELKSTIFSALNSAAEQTRAAEVWQKLVGFENAAANAAERGAGAGAMILRTVMGSFAGNLGPTTCPEQPAGRIPKLPAAPAGVTSLPLILSGGGESARQEKRPVPQAAEGEATTGRVKKLKAAGKDSSTAAAAVKDCGVAAARLAIAGSKNEGAVVISDDEDAEALESRKRFLAARAAVKGAGRGGAMAKDPKDQLCIGTGVVEGGHKNVAATQTAMVGVRFTPGNKNPFSVELHHGGVRYYLGSFSRTTLARYLSAVAQTMWHGRVQSRELVLSNKEESDWAENLDLARKMTAGLCSNHFLRKLAGNHKRMLNIFKTCRELVEADSDNTVQSALCAAVGLEVAEDDAKVKGKEQKTLFAAAVAFAFAAVWSLTAEYARCNTAGGARSAWKRVTVEVRAAAVKSGSAAAKLCRPSVDQLEGLEVCWRDVCSDIRKHQGDQLGATASIQKRVLKLYGEELDMTDKVVVHQLIQVVVDWNYGSSVFLATKGVGLYMEYPKKKGTRGKGKNGDAGEKDGKSDMDERKGEEAEHSDGEDI